MSNVVVPLPVYRPNAPLTALETLGVGVMSGLMLNEFLHFNGVLATSAGIWIAILYLKAHSFKATFWLVTLVGMVGWGVIAFRCFEGGESLRVFGAMAIGGLSLREKLGLFGAGLR